MADQEDNNKVIVSRIQQRRGLKQDLPQPLRPAEFGFTTDSRQVFIGGDPDDITATFNKSLSYFETTLSAQEHTLSIANNQIIAFTVPFIKYSKGKFDGISNLRQWEPNDARTSVTVDIACDHIGPDYNVFADNQLGTYELEVVEDAPGDNSILVQYNANANVAISNPIRIGDAVDNDSIIPAVSGVPVTVAGITADDGSNCIIQLKGYTSPTQSTENSNIVFTRGGITNFITGSSFKNNEIIVHKNGCELVPDPDPTVIAAPRSAYDYGFDASNVLSTGTHSLTLRSAPTAIEDITLSYYANTAVIQALSGVPSSDGKRYITNNVSDPAYKIESFYSAYDIPEYLELNPELIRVSTTTGLGYMGMERKHISSIAFSEVLDQTIGLTLGTFLIARNDDQRSIANVELVDGNVSLQEYSFKLDFSSDNIFSPVDEANVDTTYRYNRARLVNLDTGSSYVENVASEIINVDEANSIITVEIPAVTFQTSRDAAATLAAKPNNNYGVAGANSSIITITTTDTSGILLGDFVRIVDTSGDAANCELHDVIFKVWDTPTETTFNVKISNTTIFSDNVDNGNLDLSGNVVTDFTEADSNIAIVNHGNVNTLTGNIESTMQLFSPYKNNLTDDPSTVRVLTQTDPTFNTSVDINVEFTYDMDQEVTLRDQDQQTLFIDVDTMPIAANIAFTGTYLPTLGAIDPTDVTPVLAVDLSTATTLTEALAIINRDLVTVKDDGGTPIVEDIFPQIGFIPNTTNQLLLKQDSSYSSVSVGGLEFTLFEDEDLLTLASLGFEARIYGRAQDTVRGKLERWLNDVVGNRNINLFSRVMTIGSVPEERGATTVGVPATYTPYAQLPNLNPGDGNNEYKMYNVLVDPVFKEVQFCDRVEASNFNYLVNFAYSESLYDKRVDRLNGVRGLLNLKNNIELLTRESSILFGERELTYSNLFQVLILNEQDPNDSINDFVLEASRYNNFIIDYTIVDRNDPFNKYSRTGQMRVEGRDFLDNNSTNVITYDEYSSQSDITSPPLDGSSDPITTLYEPKFRAEWLDTTYTAIVFYLDEYQDLIQSGADNTLHSINADLVIKFAYRRWSSIDID